jgi:sporulation protein YlmC with PRC-barrel domain
MEKNWTLTFAAFVLAIAVAMAGWGIPAVSWGSEYKATEFRTSKIIGKDIKDQTGKDLGEIKDLLLDPKDKGRIAFVVIEPSGSLDFGHDRLVAIPYSALSPGGGDDIYVMNITRDKLAQAPSFDEDHWPNLSDRAWMTDVYRFFGQSPYWTPVE